MNWEVKLVGNGLIYSRDSSQVHEMKPHATHCEHTTISQLKDSPWILQLFSCALSALPSLFIFVDVFFSLCVWLFFLLVFGSSDEFLLCVCLLLWDVHLLFGFRHCRRGVRTQVRNQRIEIDDEIGNERERASEWGSRRVSENTKQTLAKD